MEFTSFSPFKKTYHKNHRKMRGKIEENEYLINLKCFLLIFLKKIIGAIFGDFWNYNARNPDDVPFKNLVAQQN